MGRWAGGKVGKGESGKVRKWEREQVGKWESGKVGMMKGHDASCPYEGENEKGRGRWTEVGAACVPALFRGRRAMPNDK